MSENNPIALIQSEYENLLREIQILKDRITFLTALRDDLVYHICPSLRSEYEEKIAGLERELFAAQLYLREKQRIIEILQAQINRNQKPSMDDAEREAGKEFQEYKEDLKRKAKEAEDFQNHWKKDSDWYEYDKAEREAERSRNQDSKDDREKDEDPSDRSAEKENGPDPEESEDSTRGEGTDFEDREKKDSEDSAHNGKKSSAVEEIKRLYRKIVKLLHPDVHPNPTEREKELLNRANDANARGDLEEMRAIWEELSGMNVAEEEYTDTPEGVARMRELIRKFKERCQALEREICHIKSEYPYTMKAFLDDEEAVEEKRNGLKEQIRHTREMDRQLAEYIEELKKNL